MAGDNSPPADPTAFTHPWISFLLKLSMEEPSFSNIEQNPNPQGPQNSNQTSHKPYAMALTNASQTQISTASTGTASDPIIPIKKDDYYLVVIEETLYQEQLKRCESSLIGRLVLAKGDKPWQFEDLRSNLQQIWSPSSSWKMSSLRKGYYNFSFSSMADRDRIWDKGTWSLKSGILALTTIDAGF